MAVQRYSVHATSDGARGGGAPESAADTPSNSTRAAVLQEVMSVLHRFRG